MKIKKETKSKEITWEMFKDRKKEIKKKEKETERKKKR